MEVDFREVFNRIRKAQRQLDRKRKDFVDSIANIEKKISSEKGAIISICRPIFANAVAEYNSNNALQISAYEIGVYIGTKEKSFFLSVFLSDSRGREPIDELENEDTKKIEDTLRPIIEEGLKKLRIPLSFNKVSHSSRYYTK